MAFVEMELGIGYLVLGLRYHWLEPGEELRNTLYPRPTKRCSGMQYRIPPPAPDLTNTFNKSR